MTDIQILAVIFGIVLIGFVILTIKSGRTQEQLKRLQQERDQQSESKER